MLDESGRGWGNGILKWRVGGCIDGGFNELGVDLGVDFGSAKDAEGDEVEPEEQGYAGTQGSVDLRGEVGEAGDVPAEGEGREETTWRWRRWAPGRVRFQDC